MFWVVPGTLLLIAATDLIVKLMFQRGALTESAASVVASIQRWSLLQLPPAVFSAVMLRLVSSFQANQLLLRVAGVGLAVNVVCDLLLKKYMGLPGIALSSALVQLTTAFYVLIIVRSRFPISK
jgi:putative peptidoglycan lipid II flippase